MNIFFSYLVVLVATTAPVYLCASPSKDALNEIKALFIPQTIYQNDNYDTLRVKRIHSICKMVPGICKAEHVTGFGVSLFVGTGVVVGVLATLAVQRGLHILSTRS